MFNNILYFYFCFVATVTKREHFVQISVPFAIEQSSGTITVVDQVTKYEQMLFDFEAVVTDQHGLRLKTNVTIQVEHPGLAKYVYYLKFFICVTYF